jgi:ABC-type multidrug transport system ATPase subunit
MIRIEAQDIGKKFNTEWIFRHVNYTFEDHLAYAILGRNGSGKSTLLQVIAGSLHPTEGKIKYVVSGKEIPPEKIFQHLSIVAPYQELIEDFTLMELLKFHFSFKSIISGHTIPQIIDLLEFKNTGNNPIRLFSSGMKQRVKLALAVLSDVPLLLLDEPTMNLDQAGIDWYLSILKEFAGKRTIIVCSNIQQQETNFCSGRLLIEDYKQ